MVEKFVVKPGPKPAKKSVSAGLREPPGGEIVTVPIAGGNLFGTSINSPHAVYGGRTKVLMLDSPMGSKEVGHFIRRRIPLLDDLASSTVTEKVGLEVEGVPAKKARALFKELQIADPELYDYLGIPKTTFNRRMAEPRGVFDGAPGQTIIGFADLLLHLSGLLEEYADPTSLKDFDAAEWLGQWLREPNPALGGTHPAELMKSPTGRGAVRRALGATFSGSFQ